MVSDLKIPDKWNAYFFSTALTTSRLSKDPSTKVGASIENHGKVISSGFNGFPRGFPDDPDVLKDRELKIMLVEHAERNAISQALFNSGAIAGGSIYITHCPCRDCAKGIIQAGIKKVHFPYYPAFEERWEFPFTENLLRTCNVEIHRYDPKILKTTISDLFNIRMEFMNE